MLVLQLGPTDPRLIKPDYLRGLNRKIRKPLIPTMTGKETLKDLINKATVIARNLEFEKGLEAKIEPKARSSSSAEPRTRFSFSTSRASTASTSVSSVNREMDSSGKFLMKLTEPEKDYIRKNRGCMNCRWLIKANHNASDCWEDHSGSGVLVKGKFLKKEHASKKESSVSALVFESDYSDSEYSRPKSVPTIRIATQVEGAALPSSLVDCGAMVNVISEDKVSQCAIPTRPMPPMQIREPLNPHGTRVNRKVVNKVRIPEDDWESQHPAEFIVAPLKEHDAIMGMQFLAEEAIQIDPAKRSVILPPPKDTENQPPSQTPENDTDSSLGANELEIQPTASMSSDTTEAAEETVSESMEEELGREMESESVPSICPKVRTSRKIRAPHQDLSWIEALQEFDDSRPESAEL